MSAYLKFETKDGQPVVWNGATLATADPAIQKQEAELIAWVREQKPAWNEYVPSRFVWEGRKIAARMEWQLVDAVYPETIPGMIY